MHNIAGPPHSHPPFNYILPKNQVFFQFGLTLSSNRIGFILYIHFYPSQRTYTNTMVTIEQCRAARGLLSWTQQDLAEASGLSKTAINNFEKGHSDIKADSLRAIRLAFESAEVEFLDSNGVRKRSEHFTSFTGHQAFQNLLDDISETLQSQGGELLVCNSNGRLSSLAKPEKVEQHYKHLEDFNIHERVINIGTAQSDWGQSNVKIIKNAPGLSTHMCSFIYGSKVAFMLWDGETIICMQSVHASNVERHRFEVMWAEAQAVQTQEQASFTQEQNASKRS